MNLQQLLETVAGDVTANEPVPVEQQSAIPHCKKCHNWDVEFNDSGLCADCAETVSRGYQISQLTGRLRSDRESASSHGVLFHARMLDANGKPEHRAACGAEPGRRSVGWSEWLPENRIITCAKCAKKVREE